MWNGSWRDEIWKTLDQTEWDLLIIGGGITGAGILREATRLGLRALLVEQRDFAWGTSSRSSKLVHGGFRYLKEGRILLTRASVHEREQLMHEGPGLIDPLGFLLTVYKGDFPGRWTMEVGLTVYDLLALRWEHKHYRAVDFRMLAPHVAREGLKCGFRYGDAQTDDARLVLRVIREAVDDGGTAINYVTAQSLLLEQNPETGEQHPETGGQHPETGGQNPETGGQGPETGLQTVCGARLQNQVTGLNCEVRARLVVNATGAWADRLRAEVGQSPRIRPLRGSHLIFPAWRLPAAQAVSFWHPLDGRPVFIFPWEGATLVGTTDVDHDEALDDEPGISPAEVAYLMAAVETQFPALNLTLDDIISTYSGVRPVIGTGKEDPSQESRDHVVWDESGLLTVTGGKLTTFRLIALDVLKAARGRFPGLPTPEVSQPVLNPVDMSLLDPEKMKAAVGNRRTSVSSRIEQITDNHRRRLLGHYAAEAPALIEAAQEGELRPIPGTEMLWAELRWAARMEGVVHLDDLLLRRVRLGLLLPEGGRDFMAEIRRICQPELGWDDERWEIEEAAYSELWNRSYSLPDRSLVPDWHAGLEEARLRRITTPEKRKKVITRSAAAAGLLTAAGLVAFLIIRRRKRRAQLKL